MQVAEESAQLQQQRHGSLAEGKRATCMQQEAHAAGRRAAAAEHQVSAAEQLAVELS